MSLPSRDDRLGLRYGNGHYERIDGVWRYTLTGQRVPNARTVRVRGRMVLAAPELHPEALVDNAEAAKLCSLTPESWRSYVARGLAPAPVLRLAASPFWTTGVLAAWLSKRPGRGGRPPKTTAA